MRLPLLFVGAILCSSIASPSASLAANYPWCAYYGFDLGGTNCGFVSFAQCMASVSGNGGYCGQNLQYNAIPEPSGRQRGHRTN